MYEQLIDTLTNAIDKAGIMRFVYLEQEDAKKILSILLDLKEKEDA